MAHARSAQRFRLNNLTQTYAKYKDIFRKKLKQKEEGTIQRHFGAAAKAIEAERAKHATEVTAAKPASVSSTTAVAEGPFRMTCSHPEQEPEKVQQLYQALVSAKQSAGEDLTKLTPESFAEFVRNKTKHLQKEKNCKEVEYVVEIVDGQAKLKALVKA